MSGSDNPKFFFTICFSNNSPSKMMKKAYYFILKTHVQNEAGRLAPDLCFFKKRYIR